VANAHAMTTARVLMLVMVVIPRIGAVCISPDVRPGKGSSSSAQEYRRPPGVLI
jgi:hypothetical protein